MAQSGEPATRWKHFPRASLLRSRLSGPNARRRIISNESQGKRSRRRPHSHCATRNNDPLIFHQTKRNLKRSPKILNLPNGESTQSGQHPHDTREHLLTGMNTAGVRPIRRYFCSMNAQAPQEPSYFSARLQVATGLASFSIRIQKRHQPCPSSDLPLRTILRGGCHPHP